MAGSAPHSCPERTTCAGVAETLAKGEPDICAEVLTGAAGGRPYDTGARAAPQGDAGCISSRFLVTTSMVRPSSSVGLNSTTSVPA